MTRKYNFFVACLVTFAVSVLLNGCILAPSLESVNRAGLTESGRKQTLNEAVKGFNTALFWENYPLATAFAAENNFETVKVILQEKRDEGRIIDSKVENIVFYDDAFKAEVDVQHRIQDFSTNVVRPLSERQLWTFSLYDGWKLDALNPSLS